MLETIFNQAKILDGLGGIWILIFLVFARCIGFASMAPLIGYRSIPALVKVSFAIILTLLIMPNLEAPAVYPKNHLFIYLIVMNALIGMFIGWVASLVIEIIRVAGEMVNMQMALQASTLFDPGSQTQTTTVGSFFYLLGLTLFVTIGGMEKVIEGLYKSYNVFPIITYDITLNFERLLSATQEVVSIGFLIISPIIVILLVMDLILGLMSRAAPQINAFQISFSIKPGIGLLILLALLPAIIPILTRLFSEPMKYFY